MTYFLYVQWTYHWASNAPRFSPIMLSFPLPSLWGPSVSLQSLGERPSPGSTIGYQMDRQRRPVPPSAGAGHIALSEVPRTA